MPTTHHRTVALVLAAVLLALPALAVAGPEEDYQEGFAAYRERGDIVGAMPPLRRAADAGHVEAQLLLGFILDWSEENEEAVRYYRMAADSGEPRGQMELARMYLSGEGVERDEATALSWIEQARDQGHAPALTQLGYAHLNGTLGFARDRGQARTLFQQALDAGDSQAQSGLAAVDAAEAAEKAAAARAAAAEEGKPKPAAQ